MLRQAASTTLATLDDDTKNRVLLAVADAIVGVIGISTQKLGPRGPMGLEEITTYKWLIEGEGQVRS